MTVTALPKKGMTITKNSLPERNVTTSITVTLNLVM